MKNLVLALSIFSLLAGYAFSDDLPAFLIEANSGYSLGINLNNAMQFDVRLYYPIRKFGLAVEGGGLFTQSNSLFHFFIGPVMHFVNTPQWRVPVILGIDIMVGKSAHFGIGGTVSVHRRLAKYFYAGLNLGIVYAFYHAYDEITGYRNNQELADVPIIENNKGFGNSLYLKPSLVVGLQF
jgi:hypothetical protein